MTAVEWFSHQILSYKSPTNINGTDYILIPINKVELLKTKAEQMENGQTEISDEEIEKAFTIETPAQISIYSGEIAGAKWYREQLKRK